MNKDIAKKLYNKANRASSDKVLPSILKKIEKAASNGEYYTNIFFFSLDDNSIIEDLRAGLNVSGVFHDGVNSYTVPRLKKKLEKLNFKVEILQGRHFMTIDWEK